MITCNHMCRASRSGRLAEYGRKPRRVLSWPKKTYRRPRATPARAENRWGAVSFRVGVETSFQNVKILDLCRMTQVFFAQGHPPKKGQAHPQPNLSPPFSKLFGFVRVSALTPRPPPNELPQHANNKDINNNTKYYNDKHIYTSMTI